MAHDTDVRELVDKELKGVITQEEKAILNSHVDSWRDVLLSMKRRTEMQFTSSKVRKFEVHSNYTKGKITHIEYVDLLGAELKWRVNAARFLQQVESKLQEVKNAELN